MVGWVTILRMVEEHPSRWLVGYHPLDNGWQSFGWCVTILWMVGDHPLDGGWSSWECWVVICWKLGDHPWDIHRELNELVYCHSPVCGGGVRFAQSFLCPTQLQCWGCVVLCCCWGCDNMNWKIQLHKFEICISKLAYLHLVIFNINLVLKHSSIRPYSSQWGGGLMNASPCVILFSKCVSLTCF